MEFEEKIRRLHIKSNCKNTCHNNLNYEDFFFANKPLWLENCCNNLTESESRKLLRVCESLNLQCNCTSETDCNLCINIFDLEYEPFLFIDYNNIISLKVLFALLDVEINDN